jgi:hypothetical protein
MRSVAATAAGHAPQRGVVKADAVWESGPDGNSRIDLAITLKASSTKPGKVDPWPAPEAGTTVGGAGPPGTVHVVTSVRGADVWMLVGLGPEARIEQLACDEAVDVLLAGSSQLRKRLHVDEKAIQAAGADPKGAGVVTVSARTL